MAYWLVRLRFAKSLRRLSFRFAAPPVAPIAAAE
jgi:hypothetical protein